MPCRLAPPDPRARPSSTVSAWSSSVWRGQHGGRADRRAPRRERGVARGARGGLGAAVVRRRRPRTTRASSPRARALRRGRGRGIRRSRLQPVVDGDRDGRDRPSLRRLEGRRGGEGERVGAARERDHDGRGRRQGRQGARAPRGAPRRRRGRGRVDAPHPPTVPGRSARRRAVLRIVGSLAMRQPGTARCSSRTGHRAPENGTARTR